MLIKEMMTQEAVKSWAHAQITPNERGAFIAGHEIGMENFRYVVDGVLAEQYRIQLELADTASPMTEDGIPGSRAHIALAAFIHLLRGTVRGLGNDDYDEARATRSAELLANRRGLS